MNKCFLLNSEKNLAQICLVIFEKNRKLLNSHIVQFQKTSQQVRLCHWARHLTGCLYLWVVRQVVTGGSLTPVTTCLTTQRLKRLLCCFRLRYRYFSRLINEQVPALYLIFFTLIVVVLKVVTCHQMLSCEPVFGGIIQGWQIIHPFLESYLVWKSSVWQLSVWYVKQLDQFGNSYIAVETRAGKSVSKMSDLTPDSTLISKIFWLLLKVPASHSTYFSKILK